MNRTNITNAVVFPKLKGILEEDIIFLKRMNYSIKQANYQKFIGSIISAKDKILKILSSTEGERDVSPTPPEKLHIVGYKENDACDLSKLISAFKQTEDEQLSFVRNAVVNEGMPDDLLKKLKKILKIYEDITEQLGRSYKTKQFNPIVV